MRTREHTIIQPKQIQLETTQDRSLLAQKRNSREEVLTLKLVVAGRKKPDRIRFAFCFQSAAEVNCRVSESVFAMVSWMEAEKPTRRKSQTIKIPKGLSIVPQIKKSAV